ncbi:MULTISPECIES: putative RNA methyltransferase [Shewanella]|uniref:rRNA (Guanine-N(1)-)-methyltransferase n=2 Tax=Shewanella putrefaciens TaxID=24 RepID=A4Y4F8_SHEPC|nr:MULTISPECIES: SAM-dependent methyltransferase [Shewanella]CAD6366965.1 23S rRNA (guanine(745)-N(1))-methyltransferase [Shewanella hafniensis]AVV83319.1 SAM-dependent methyltransferase [Shewanella putrefaciens]MCK7628503.1 SAM-dependent methyltransferase [Shewanella sp. JNE9-1]MCK7632389.1 SAM-dependent methyltransferase [Shewanella sp. JNE17]MCK7643752.1 SAM-dependent methyltransferase [Shewanella sp. JNE3-1]
MSLKFQCPTCGLSLQQHQSSQGFHCTNKHHFDKSEQGYWVFTKPQRQKPTGDSRQQVRAKRFLLESGIFAPLIDKMAEMLVGSLQDDISLLDYECAEGFYLRALSSKLTDIAKGLTIQYVGVADAENTIFSAAKAQTPGILCLSTSKVLPFSDNCIDVITVIDKPLKGKESVRVLKEDGLMLLVLPGARHLWQLKEYIYPDLAEKTVQINLPSGLLIIETQTLHFTLSVTGEQALTLLDMTPYAWRATDRMKHNIQSNYFESLEIDFILVLARKCLSGEAQVSCT